MSGKISMPGTAADLEAHQAHSRAVTLGTALALVSAVLYTATNIFLKLVTACDPFWVSCLKAFPTLIAAAVMVGWTTRQGRSGMPGARGWLVLFGTGLLAHIGGNVGFQYGLGVLGLATAVPLTFSVILVAGALIGRVWLGEPVSVRSAVALLVLCVSIGVLGLHTAVAKAATGSGTAALAEVDSFTKGLAVAAIIFAGFSYTMLGAVIRRTITGTTGMGATLLIISIAGVAALGGIGIVRLGIDGIFAIRPIDHQWMLLAGTCNAVAFLMLTKALHLVPIAYVNVINASQVAMAAVAGVAWFAEPSTAYLAIGLGLMIVGLIGMERPKRRAGPGGSAEVPVVEELDPAVPLAAESAEMRG
jgi:drug/metabolite transporter (DMT)-like permease